MNSRSQSCQVDMVVHSMHKKCRNVSNFQLKLMWHEMRSYLSQSKFKHGYPLLAKTQIFEEIGAGTTTKSTFSTRAIQSTPGGSCGMDTVMYIIDTSRGKIGFWLMWRRLYTPTEVIFTNTTGRESSYSGIINFTKLDQIHQCIEAAQLSRNHPWFGSTLHGSNGLLFFQHDFVSNLHTLLYMLA
jgi:hypothetical protein